MPPADYMSVATATRIPATSTQNLNSPLYIAQAEERAKCIEEERPWVEELRELTRRYQHEYLRITTEICRPRTRFNAMAYVSRLPTEILGLIFEAYVADHWESYYSLQLPTEDSDEPEATPYEWIKGVLHVCRQWRRIALSTPQLWTVIVQDRIYEPWRLELLLEHAGRVPLTLRNDYMCVLGEHFDPEDASEGGLEDLHNHDSPGMVIFRQTLQNFVRLETLMLIVTPKMEEILTTLTHVDAPLMKHLDLDLTRDNDALKHSPLFLNVNMPRLKSLTLGMGPSELMQRLSCPSLTRLHVSLCDHISVRELLDVFNRTPRLQQFSVNPVVPDEGTTPQRAVQLPSLDHFWLYGSVRAAGQLLRQLVFPASTLIELHTEDGFPAPLLSDVMPAVRGQTAGGSALGRTESTRSVGPYALCVRPHDDDLCMTSMWFPGMPTPPTYQPQPAQDDARNPRGSRPTLDPFDRPRLNLIAPCSTFRLDMLDTTDARSLSLAERVFRNDWAETLTFLRRPACPKLETLWLDNDEILGDFLCALIELAEAAAPVAASNADDGCSSPAVQAPAAYLPLPSLRTLVANNVMLDTTERRRIDEHHDETFSRLRRCAELGFRFQLLRLMLVDNDKEDAAKNRDDIFKLGIADVVEIISPSDA